MAAGAVSLRKSHDIVILSFCNIVKGQANHYISGCQYNCQQNQECQVWTFNSMSGGKGNNCWLKTSDAFMSFSSPCVRISGPKYCGKKI